MVSKKFINKNKVTIVLLILLILFSLVIATYYYMLHVSKEHFKNTWKNNKKKYFIVIAAIFKNENDYLDEWLNFNIKEGIDHFYMFDNNDRCYK